MVILASLDFKWFRMIDIRLAYLVFIRIGAGDNCFWFVFFRLSFKFVCLYKKCYVGMNQLCDFDFIIVSAFFGSSQLYIHSYLLSGTMPRGAFKCCPSLPRYQWTTFRFVISWHLVHIEFIWFFAYIGKRSLYNFMIVKSNIDISLIWPTQLSCFLAPRALYPFFLHPGYERASESLCHRCCTLSHAGKPDSVYLAKLNVAWMHCRILFYQFWNFWFGTTTQLSDTVVFWSQNFVFINKQTIELVFDRTQ